MECEGGHTTSMRKWRRWQSLDIGKRFPGARVIMASPPRIRMAFCLDSFAIGGTEPKAVRTAEAGNPDWIELCVFSLQTRGPLRSRYERLGVPMIRVPIPNLYPARTTVQGVRLARLLRRRNVDVVHSHDIYCNVLVVPWARMLTGCSIIASRRWGIRHIGRSWRRSIAGALCWPILCPGG